MSLLPLQGALYGPRLPRVPASLRAASALGYGLVGLSGRAFPPIDPNIQSQIQLPIRISRPSGLAWPLPKRPSSLARLLCPFCLCTITRQGLFLRYKEKAVGCMASLPLIHDLTGLIAVKTVLMRVFSVLMPGSVFPIPVGVGALLAFPIGRAANFSYSLC